MRKSGQGLLIAFLFVGCFMILLQVSHVEAGVIGIDLGSTWFKVGAIQGTVFDIVVNPEGRRKQPVLMGFDRGDRVFGRDAERLWNRDPRSIFGYSTQLLGKPLNHSFFQTLAPHFPYSMTQDDSRGGAILLPVDQAHDGRGSEYTPEEIVATILGIARQTVRDELNTDIPDVVIAIPPFLTQHERLALKNAASVAGLNLLSFIHNGAAIALNYALSRSKEELAQSHHVLFYDMGASQTSVSLVFFSHVPGQSKSKAEDLVPQAQIVATAWDETLGGREFDHRLTQYLAEQASILSHRNVKEYPRAMAALLNEARRVKEVLSANSDAKVMIEGLFNDFDFKFDVSRKKFEELCADLLQRVTKPLVQVLQASGLSSSDINSLEIFGGGTRVPAVQEAISQAFDGRPVSKHLNSDDAAALGATFFAATTSSTLKIKTQYRVKDIISLPVTANVTSGGGLDDADRVTTIIRPDNRLGLKKTLSFRTSDASDIEIVLSYPEDSVPAGTPSAFQHYRISSLPQKDVEKYLEDPKIVLSFRLEKNGIVSLEQADAHYSVEVMVPQVVNTTSETEEKADAADTVGGTSSEEKVAQPNTDAAAAPNADEASSENPTKDDTSDETEKAQPAPSATILVPTIQERVKSLTIHSDYLGLIPLTAAQIRSAKASISRFEKVEKQKAETAEARNALEAFIYEAREKVDDDEELAAHSTEEERSELRSLLLDAGDWLYDEGAEASLAEYRQKLTTCRVIYDKIIKRISQRSVVPLAFTAFESELNATLPLIFSYFRDRNITAEEQGEFNSTLTEFIVNIQSRLQTQASLPLYEDAIVAVEEIEEQVKWLQKQNRRFRARPYKIIPKPKKSAPSESSPETPSQEESANETSPQEEVPTEDGHTAQDSSQQQEETNQPNQDETESDVKENQEEILD